MKIFLFLIGLFSFQFIFTNDLTEKELLEQGELLFNERRIQEAIQKFTLAIELNPKNYLPYFKRALGFLKEERYTSVLADLAQVCSLNPVFQQAFLLRGKVYILIGKLQQANEDFEKVLEIDKKNSEAKSQKKIIQNLQKKIQRLENIESSKSLTSSKIKESIKILDEILSSCSRSVDFNLKRAKYSLDSKDYYEAIKFCKRARISDYGNNKVLLLLGKIMLQMEDIQASNDYFHECLKYDPDNKLCLKEYKKIRSMNRGIKEGNEKLEQKQYEKALESFSQVLSLLDGNLLNIQSTLYQKKCECLYNLEKYKEAKTECTKSLEMNPQNSQAFLFRGECNSKLEEYDQAIHDFESAQSYDHTLRNIVNEKIHNCRIEKKKLTRKDYYKILDIQKDANPSQIKKAYHVLAKKYHPDVVSSDVDKEEAEKKFIEISEAYEILSNPDKKARYDSGQDLFDDPHGGGGFHNFQGFPFQGFEFPGFNGNGFQFVFNF
ncbi:hypothetical protein M0811_11424 [Anaeramoeba ignava]|uniref:J domain-containing protein n=1 Tax=Anaeramoeba ignava TaxID=1746090 RepID=A0A9Q0R7A8_ANAIG|nr:hypothetical protein M0811_11424 [Anaeramoeba ignava]